jgi:hypothetical protein
VEELVRAGCTGSPRRLNPQAMLRAGKPDDAEWHDDAGTRRRRSSKFGSARSATPTPAWSDRSQRKEPLVRASVLKSCAIVAHLAGPQGYLLLWAVLAPKRCALRAP